jgi:phage FluMu gp28-like protein
VSAVTRAFDGWVPHAGQQAFLDAAAPVKALACGRRWGKTEACARDVYLSAITGRHRRQVIAAPSYDQARLIFDRAAGMLRAAGTPGLTISRSHYPVIRHSLGTVTARSAARDGRFLRGHGADRVVVDEAAYVPRAVIEEVLMPMLAESRGQLVMVSTPCGKNHFHEWLQRAREGDPDVWFRTGPTWENPLVPRGFLRSQQRLLTERQFRVEYEASFEENAAAVFRSAWIEAALELRIGRLPDGAPTVMGVDWARYSDFTALVGLRGSRQRCEVVSVERFNQLPWGEQVDRAAAKAGLLKPTAILCDNTSVGDPLLEQLQMALPGAHVEGVIFTAQTKRELVDRLVWMLENGKMRLLPDVELLRELHHFEADTLESGRVQLEAACGYHDDVVMALALAAAALPEYEAPPRVRTIRAAG